MALGNLDGDTDLDAVVVNGFGGAETVWLNNGSASFGAHPTTHSFGAGASHDVALGDLDGDNHLDAVIANEFPEAETVRMNANAPDSVAPSCSYTIVNANPKRSDFTVSDAGNGLKTIQITTTVNIVTPVSIPPFTVGTTSPVSFSVVRANQAQPARVAVVITDVNGNQSSCI
ncbi:MAG: FG-GAP repeat domain-containing protein [Acidimicrobiales bacterium]